MKQLIIVRHGKACDDLAEIKDIDRHLVEIGILRTHEMGERLFESGIAPDLVISSPAARALHTTSILCRKMKIDFEKLKIETDIYFSYIDEVIKLIKKTDNKVSSLMIVGHNPTLSDIANTYLKNAIFHMPTSGIVVLEFDTKRWDEISNTNVKREIVDHP